MSGTPPRRAANGVMPPKTSADTRHPRSQLQTMLPQFPKRKERQHCASDPSENLPISRRKAGRRLGSISSGLRQFDNDSP